MEVDRKREEWRSSKREPRDVQVERFGHSACPAIVGTAFGDKDMRHTTGPGRVAPDSAGTGHA